MTAGPAGAYRRNVPLAAHRHGRAGRAGYVPARERWPGLTWASADAAAGSLAGAGPRLGAVALGVLPVMSMSGALVSRGGL